MDKKKHPKAWFHAINSPNVPDLHKGFYDASNLSWVKHLELNWELIRDEAVAFMNGNAQDIHPYFDNTLVASLGTWKSFPFFVWGKRSFGPAIKKCPKTIEVLKSIPDMVSASISIMEPMSKILPHSGDTNTTMRCHLGLIVPGGLPHCGFHVEPEQKAWQEGKMLAFNDASSHYAWNNTPKRRVVMLIDVIRPEFRNRKLSICTLINATLVGQFIGAKIPILRKMMTIIYIFTVMAWVIYFPIVYIHQKLYFKRRARK